MDFTSYILPELLVLVPVMYALGHILKVNKRVADESIPAVLSVCGVVLAFLYIMSTTPLNSTQAVGAAIFAALTQGVLVTAAAVFINQLAKQGSKSNIQIPNVMIDTILDLPTEDQPTDTEEHNEDVSDGSLQALKETHKMELKPKDNPPTRC